MSETPRDLEARLESLAREVATLRGEVDALKASGAARPAPAPPQVVSVAAKPAAAAPAVPKRRWKFDEKFVGETLTQYAGMGVLALGVLFFLLWTAAYAGPQARVAIAAGVGAALAALGVRASKRPPYDRLAGTLIGGGWTVLYLTVYASYHVSATKVLSSATTELGLLLAVAAGMVAHAVSRKSRPLRLYAVALTYAVMFLCGRDSADFDFFMILFAASAAVAVETGEADVLVVSLVGYYVDYAPAFVHALSLPASARTAAGLALPLGQIAGPYALTAALPLLPKARAMFARREGEKCPCGEVALCLNAGLFFIVGAALTRRWFGSWTLERAAPLSALLAAGAAVQAWRLSRRSAAAGLGGVLALVLLAAAAMALPDPMWRLTAWIALACSWTWLGLQADQAAWRVAGLAAALLTFAIYAYAVHGGPAPRREAALAMIAFAAPAYLFSRFYRLSLREPMEWEKEAKSLWLHIGTTALACGLWGFLDAGPFLAVLAAGAIVAEHAAVRFEREDLWAQASVLQWGMCAYSPLVDYGSGARVLGLAPRLWTTGLLAASAYYLYFDGPATAALAGRWTRWTLAQSRRALSWLALGAVAFAVYQEFGARLRLPVWALGAAALLVLGRLRGDEDLRKQGVALSLIAALEAVATYLLGPGVLIGPSSGSATAFYWLACAGLLTGLSAVKNGRAGEPNSFDAGAARLLGALPMFLGACFFAKELDRTAMTLAWTGLGLAGLLGGLGLDWAELRHPALGLLGLCVVKALVFDTAGLALPYRVASFVTLGVVLLAASSLYARRGARSASNEKNPAAAPR